MTAMHVAMAMEMVTFNRKIRKNEVVLIIINVEPYSTSTQQVI